MDALLSGMNVDELAKMQAATIRVTENLYYQIGNVPPPAASYFASDDAFCNSETWEKEVFVKAVTSEDGNGEAAFAVLLYLDAKYSIQVAKDPMMILMTQALNKGNIGAWMWVLENSERLIQVAQSLS
jgi:hypothetical protein